MQLEKFKTDPQDTNMIVSCFPLLNDHTYCSYCLFSFQFGFSLDRTQNDVANPLRETYQDQCILQEDFHTDHDTAVIYFILDLKDKRFSAHT